MSGHAEDCAFMKGYGPCDCPEFPMPARPVAAPDTEGAGQ